MRVVIVGAGPAGLATEKLLRGHDVTLVAAGPLEWRLGQTYAVTHPDSYLKTVSIDKYKAAARARVVVGKAVEVSDGEVVLADGQRLGFDACVICTGFSCPGLLMEPGQSLEDRVAEVRRIGSAVKDASCVLIGGAGVTGIMLAGDVRDVNPRCRVVCVTRGPRARSDLSEANQAKLDAVLRAKRIEILAGTEVRADSWSVGPRDFELTSGGKVEADVYLPAFATPCGHFAGKLANAKGQLTVNEFLQSTVDPRVFAVCCHDRPQPTTLMAVESESATAAKNVRAMLKGEALSRASAAAMRHPPLQPVGHESYAFIALDVLPAPAACCLKVCGFPLCPPLLCYPCYFAGLGPCHPCCCGWCCGDPAGKGTAALAMFPVFATGSTGIKGLGDAVGKAGKAPSQAAM